MIKLLIKSSLFGNDSSAGISKALHIIITILWSVNHQDNQINHWLTLADQLVQ